MRDSEVKPVSTPRIKSSYQTTISHIKTIFECRLSANKKEAV